MWVKHYLDKKHTFNSLIEVHQWSRIFNHSLKFRSNTLEENRRRKTAKFTYWYFYLQLATRNIKTKKWSSQREKETLIILASGLQCKMLLTLKASNISLRLEDDELRLSKTSGQVAWLVSAPLSRPRIWNVLRASYVSSKLRPWNNMLATEQCFPKINFINLVVQGTF